jgi:hypothetical protein
LLPLKRASNPGFLPVSCVGAQLLAIIHHGTARDMGGAGQAPRPEYSPPPPSGNHPTAFLDSGFSLSSVVQVLRCIVLYCVATSAAAGLCPR